MQKIWMYIIAHFGAKCTFLRKNALLAPEKKGEKLTHGEPNWVFLGQNTAAPFFLGGKAPKFIPLWTVGPPPPHF